MGVSARLDIKTMFEGCAAFLDFLDFAFRVRTKAFHSHGNTDKISKAVSRPLSA